MERGRSTKLVGATGEYLVAAELCRRGLIATTFTGNVPHYDIVASDGEGRHAAVQVKTSRSTKWQLANVGLLFDVTLDEATKTQAFGRLKKPPVNRLVYVYVVLSDEGPDRFFVVSWKDLASLVRKSHGRYLKRHNWSRPQRWDSLHAAITADHLADHEDCWEVVEAALR
ncbi:MAG: hypothetical protein O2865_16325 [Planctomycetota bacterium]|nr:hypothetical protein [Planctomycetota bacterium]MDA1223219.1 hypothetical protein [Planctomycetota bacterium]